MGCFESKEERESKAVNKEIEKLLKEDEEKMKDEVKMLLLGTWLSRQWSIPNIDTLSKNQQNIPFHRCR